MKAFLTLAFALCLFSCKQHVEKATESPSPIEILMKGNNRFQTNKPIHPDQAGSRLRELTEEQHPFAIVISCSDSRVPPELVFDQGLGDLFVIRTAGHALGDYELASIEYAVEHLHMNNIIVLGHENCGAIKTLMEHPTGKLPGHLNDLVQYLRTEPEEQDLFAHRNKNLKKAIVANIEHAVSTIAHSQPILKPKVDHGHLNVYGAYYHLSNGKVDLVRK
ncbi:carbonic anhydrase [Aridibaculum aurantiacum]|uniref:carbonic anhydrase n=1 Tax=Aridibaculum aurantiacum TaxID=2810307 RepID=UPI001A95BE45|nr:carbonic anhydrase [Aridibaculum aurantiacum]